MKTSPVSFNINGRELRLEVHPAKRLLDVIREDLHLTGTKEGCGEGECGACSVIMNGELVNSCLVPALHADGKAIRTIEDLGSSSVLHPIEQAFAKLGGAQCGICTPGMIMAAACLLDRTAAPSRDEIREALAGNLCRCTGYQKIIDAVYDASRSQ